MREGGTTVEVKYLLVISDILRVGGGRKNLTQVLSMNVRGSYSALQLFAGAPFACCYAAPGAFHTFYFVLAVKHDCLMLLSDLLGLGPVFESVKHCHSPANCSCYCSFLAM